MRRPETGRRAPSRRGPEIAADMSAGHYRIFQAEGNLPEPVWPNKPFKELLRIAFRGRTIDNVEHPIVKQCRGLAP